MSVPAVQSSLALPAPLVRASLAPSYVALCACMDPGASAAVRVTVQPEAGTSSVTVDDAPLQACVDRELGAGRFPPFALGSDCIDCGPKSYGVLAGSAPPPKPPSSAIMFSLAFARP